MFYYVKFMKFAYVIQNKLLFISHLHNSLECRIITGLPFKQKTKEKLRTYG